MKLLIAILLTGSVFAEDAIVRRIERKTVTYYGYAGQRNSTGTVTRAEVWHCESPDGKPVVSVELPPQASAVAKRATALAEIRKTLKKGNATLKAQP